MNCASQDVVAVAVHLDAGQVPAAARFYLGAIACAAVAKAPDLAHAQRAALDWLGSHGMETIERVLGLKTPAAVAEQLAPRIEAKVEESRKVLVAAPSGRVIVAPAP